VPEVVFVFPPLDVVDAVVCPGNGLPVEIVVGWLFEVVWPLGNPPIPEPLVVFAVRDPLEVEVLSVPVPEIVVVPCPPGGPGPPLFVVDVEGFCPG
jgi:hypothetical protein